MRLFRYLVLAGMWLLPCQVAAEPVVLEEIVVQGELLPTTEETLTIREVRESSARDIGEALESLPGLTGVRKGGIANDVVLRGFQGDDINVLMDGVRVHGGCPSRMDPPSFHFDFAEVESISVVKGPYSLRYPGSLAGLVEISGRGIEPGLGASANLTYGSFELFHASATGSYGGETLETLIGYAYKYSLPPESGDGKRITDIYPQTSPNRYRSDELDSRAYEINTVWLKEAVKLSSSARTELSLSYQDADHVLYPGLLMDAEYDRTTRADWRTSVEKPFAGLDRLELQLYWTAVEHLMNDRLRESSQPSMAVTRDVMMETDAETGVLGGSLFGSGKLAGGELSGGVDAYRRNWDAENISAAWNAYAPQAMIPDVDSDQLGAFAEYQHSLTATWGLKGGVRFDYLNSDAQALEQDRLDTLYQPYYSTTLASENDFSEPSGNLQLFWKPRDGVELFTGVASAARMPDPQELYIGLQRFATMMNPGAFNWIGNPDLQPVRNNQADLGAKFSGGRYLVSGSLFYSRADNYIAVVELPDPDGAGPLVHAKSYENIDAEIWGGELDVQVSLPLDLFLLADLSYTEAEDRDSGTPIAETPPLMGSAAVRYDIETLFVELGERFADRQDKVDPGLSEEETPGWGVTDLKAGLNLKRWRFIAGVNNLFDSYYQTHLSYQRDPFRSGVKVPETGRFAFLTVGYRF